MKNLSVLRVRPYMGQNGKVYLSYSQDGKLKRVNKSVIEIIIDESGNILQMSPSIEEILCSEDINVNRSNVSAVVRKTTKEERVKENGNTKKVKAKTSKANGNTKKVKAETSKANTNDVVDYELPF